MQQLQPMYECGLREHWRRQIGDLHPIAFSRTIGGCEDLIQRLSLYAKLDGHNDCVNTVHFNPTGELLISGSDDREIVFWDWAAKVQKLSYSSGHDSNVFQARVMPFSDDRSIISCAADGQVRHGQILDNGKVQTKSLAKHKGRAHKLAIEPGSPRTFLSCGEDGVVRQFDLREEKSTKLFVCHSFPPGSGKRDRHNIVRLNAIVINPRNCNYFSVGGSDEFARVYDIRRVNADASGNADQPVNSFTPKHLFGTDQVHITCVAYSQQEELLVSYNDELIYLFDDEMGLGPNPKERQSTEDTGNSDVVGPQPRCPEPEVYKGHRNAQTVKGVNFFGPNTEYVVSGSDCGRIFIWKKRGAKLIALRHGDSQVVNCLEPHPYSTILATSGIDRTVKIWAPTANELLPLPSDAEKVMELNSWRRENRSHISLTPDSLMNVLRLQRRHAQRDHDRGHSQTLMDEDVDDDDDDDYMDFEELSSDEGGTVNPRECIIG